MKIHPRLAGGLIVLFLILILIIIDKIFNTNIFSNRIVLIVICLIGGIVAGVISKRQKDD